MAFSGVINFGKDFERGFHMFVFSRRSLVAVIALSLFAVAECALAQSPKIEAKQHFDAGNALVENEDYSAAAAEFEVSVSLYATKMGLFNLANCYKALNRYGDALEALARLEREFAGKLGDLADEVASLKATIEGMVGPTGRSGFRLGQDLSRCRKRASAIGRSTPRNARRRRAERHVVTARPTTGAGSRRAARRRRCTVRRPARFDSQSTLLPTLKTTTLAPFADRR